MWAMCLRLGFCLVVACGLFAGEARQALADAPESTLERIRREGVLRIGYGGNVPPFSFLDSDGKVIGYSIAICERVAEDLRQQLGLERLGITYVQRTPMNRVQMLNNGDYDLECDASTQTQERRLIVAFSLSHYFVATRFVALARNNLRTIDDLKGRSMAAALGTVNVGQVGDVNRHRKLQISMVKAQTFKEAFAMVTDGRAAAFAMDDIILTMLVATSGRPEIYSISDEVLSPVEPLGFMMRLQDKPFQDAVNAALARIYADPAMDGIYAQWFMSPVQGLGISFDVPMSPALAAHFASFR